MPRKIAMGHLTTDRKYDQAAYEETVKGLGAVNDLLYMETLDVI